MKAFKLWLRANKWVVFIEPDKVKILWNDVVHVLPVLDEHLKGYRENYEWVFLSDPTTPNHATYHYQVSDHFTVRTRFSTVIPTFASKPIIMSSHGETFKKKIEERRRKRKDLEAKKEAMSAYDAETKANKLEAYLDAHARKEKLERLERLEKNAAFNELLEKYKKDHFL